MSKQKKPKIKASENKAETVETKLPVFLRLPVSLREAVITALQTSTPTRLTVEQVNGICNKLNQLPNCKK